VTPLAWDRVQCRLLWPLGYTEGGDVLDAQSEWYLAYEESAA
jgi:hypothetical protein